MSNETGLDEDPGRRASPEFPTIYVQPPPMDAQTMSNGQSDQSDLFFAEVARGALALDGVMSPLTRSLMARFETQSVDMTLPWCCTAMDWVCPACGRSKPQIVRLNAKGSLMRRLVEHRDHMKDLVTAEFERECTS